jgi:lysophospholipase L1-like esterase
MPHPDRSKQRTRKPPTQAGPRLRVVCLGDSLTEASDVAPDESWHALAAAKTGAELVNCGIGGDTSAGLLSRFQADVVARRPHAVILLGGANDLWWDLDLGSIQANLFTMACQASFHRIVPIVGLPPPIDAAKARARDMFQPLAGWDVCCRKLAQLAEALRTAARSCQIACLDVHRPFLAPDGTVRGDLYLENGLHPNPGGHRLMAEAAAALIADIPPGRR